MTNNNSTQTKRITKAELNQVAKHHYGTEAYCEHVRTGQRGWYLYQGEKQIFLGNNATDALQTLQQDTTSVPVESLQAHDPKERPFISPQAMLEILFDKFPHTFFKEQEKIRPVQKYVHKKIRRAVSM